MGRNDDGGDDDDDDDDDDDSGDDDNDVTDVDESVDADTRSDDEWLTGRASATTVVSVRLCPLGSSLSWHIFCNRPKTQCLCLVHM